MQINSWMAELAPATPAARPTAPVATPPTSSAQSGKRLSKRFLEMQQKKG